MAGYRPHCSGLLLVGLGLGCAEPFEVRRQVLEPFRIAALGVVDGEAQAAIWSGEGMGHSQAPLLEWSMNGVCIGEGWAVEPSGEGLLELRATSASGEQALAQVSIGDAPEHFEIQRWAVEIGEETSIDARAALQENEVLDGVEDGYALRLRVPAEPSLRAHFMVAGVHGSLLELDTLSADFLAEDLVFDDTELISREPAEAGLFHLLVLVQDLAGGNRWTWLDAPMGLEGSWLRSGERRLDLDVESSTGLVAVELDLSEDFEAFSLRNPEAVSDTSSQTALDCAPSTAPFDLDWITNGRCGLDELSGARLILELQ